MTDSIDAIQTIIAEGQDPWEALIDAGIAAGESMDDGKWVIGDAALLVSKQYGEDRLGEFAHAINREKERVGEYRTVCRFWDRKKSARAEIRANYPVITYTHLRDAMRFKDLQLATDFIMECVANNWGVERARLERDAKLGKPTPPKKLMDGEAKLLFGERYGLDRRLFFETRVSDEVDSLIEAGSEKYRLVVYEVKEGQRDDLQRDN